jgi:hypothetical protein
MNIFENFCFEYYTYITNIIEKTNCTMMKTKSYIDFIYYALMKKHPITTEEVKSIKKLDIDYEEIISQLDYNSDNFNVEKWLEIVKSFTLFIRYAEKCFMFKNTDENNIYAETEVGKDKSIVLYIKFKDYKIKFIFDKTKIQKENYNNILLLATEDSKYVSMYTIELVRNFGKNMMNRFRFISGEEPTFNDISDKILFKRILSDTSEIIINTFGEILNSILLEYKNIENQTNWKEVIKDGVWVR